MEKIVVTGASSGIGLEIASQLARPGRKLWLIGRNRERLQDLAATVEAKGAAAEVVALDLMDREACARFLDSSFPEGDPADEVYLSAAVSMFGEVKDVLDEDWRWIYETNLLSPVQWMLHYYRGMAAAGRGRIVLISSLSAYTGYPTAVPYATMKAGLMGVFRSIRHEGELLGVRFHLVSPGYVDTEIYKRAKYRSTSYEQTMRLIGTLGFKVISAEEAARRIVRKVAGGKRDLCFPAYAWFLASLAPRMPFIIDRIHRRILERFRRTAA